MSKPQSYDELFPGRFLKAGLFKGKDVTLTIKAVDTESFEQGKDDDGNEKPDKIQGILSFEETPKQLALNSTNGQCIRAMFGTEVQTDWLGKKVTLSPEKTKMYDQGSGKMETVDCIRIKGSPDIKEAFTVTIKLPRKKDTSRRMALTGKKERERQPGEDPE